MVFEVGERRFWRVSLACSAGGIPEGKERCGLAARGARLLIHND